MTQKASCTYHKNYKVIHVTCALNLTQYNRLDIICNLLLSDLVEYILGIWSGDHWTNAGVIHYSVHHLHLCLSICLQSLL